MCVRGKENASERGKKKTVLLVKERGGGCNCVSGFVCVHASMCGSVNVCAPTCSGADKLQNQGPAGDNTRSTG